jgi:cytochrome P450/NADPH-cytochrome P450 reductase
VVIVTASYEGHPTENAKEFMDWLSLQGTGSLNGLHYCVFGCGNRQWAQTYQAIPTRIDQSLFEAGAQRFRPRGQADANGHFEADFEAWLPGLWPALRALDADATTPAEVGV